MVSLDRLNLMRLLVRIAEAGSLSGAARSLGLSQPSASRQLRQLETLLGAQLINRTTHELTLTEAGRRFLEDARGMLAQWERAAEAVRSQQEAMAGPIRVAAPVALGQTLLARIAAQFIGRHPGLQLDWRLTDEPGDLVAGGYDLWIRAGPIDDQRLIVRDLWRIERVIVSSARRPCPAHPAGLQGQPAVQLVTYVPLDVLLSGPGGQRAMLRQRPAFATDNIYAALVAVEEGAGYAILPLWLVQGPISRGSLVHCCPGWQAPPLTLSVAYAPSLYQPVRVGAFVDFLRRELPETGAGIAPLRGQHGSTDPG
jgi:molybdate transport repressor ModE-like protein